MAAIPHLQKQLQELVASPPAGFRVVPTSNIYAWTIWFTGPEGSPYAGGQYRAVMNFPRDFPMSPPDFRITSSFWHPNVYSNGRFCISILHAPGEDDLNSEESALMRWTPVRTISSVLLSIMSLLNDLDPDDSGAPANVDALVQYRKEPEQYREKCHALAQKSLTELPENFIPPSLKEPATKVHPSLDWLSSDDMYASGAGSCSSHATGSGNLLGSKTHPESSEDDLDRDDEFDDVLLDVEDMCEDGTETEYGSQGSASSGSRKRNYRDELQQLRDMDFASDKSDETLLELLTKHRGEIANVIIELSE